MSSRSTGVLRTTGSHSAQKAERGWALGPSMLSVERGAHAWGTVARTQGHSASSILTSLQESHEQEDKNGLWTAQCRA